MFDEPDATTLHASVNLDFVGPPSPFAFGALALGVISVLLGLLLNGSLGWVGYSLGFAGVLTGIAYRWLMRTRQMVPMFLPNYVVDRVMLAGVLLGFCGIALNAYHVAQQVIE